MWKLVESGEIDGVTVGDGTSWRKDAITSGPPDDLSHLGQDCLLHQGEYWGYFVGVSTGVESVRNPLACETDTVDATT